MKTKEEILSSEWDCNERDLQVEIVLNSDIGKIKSAMDEYAKEVAIEYGMWLLERSFPDRVKKEVNELQKAKNTVFNQFIEQLHASNPNP